MFISLIPPEANYLRRYWNRAIEFSKNNQRMGVVLPVQITAFAAIDAISYLFHGIFKGCSKLASGEFQRAYTHLTTDVFSTIRCGFLIFEQIPYIFCNLFWNPKNLATINPLPLHEKTKQKLQRRIEKERNALDDQLKQLRKCEEELNKQLQKTSEQRYTLSMYLYEKGKLELEKNQIQKQANVADSQISNLNLQLRQNETEILSINEEMNKFYKKVQREKDDIITEKNELEKLGFEKIQQVESKNLKLEISLEQKNKEFITIDQVLKTQGSKYKTLNDELENYKQINTIQEFIKTQKIMQKSQEYIKKLEDQISSLKEQIYSLSHKKSLEIKVNGETAWKNQKYRHVLNPVENSIINIDEQILLLKKHNSDLAINTREALEILKSQVSHSREQYKKFITALRKAIVTPEYKKTVEIAINNKNSKPNIEDPFAGFGNTVSDECVKTILLLCEALFTKVELFSFTKSLLDEIAPRQNGQNNLCEILAVQKTMIDKLDPTVGENPFKRYFYNFRGHTDTGFDPHFDGNPNSLVYQETYLNKDGKKLSMNGLRFATPTYQPKTMESPVMDQVSQMANQIPGANYLSHAVNYFYSGMTSIPIIGGGINKAGQVVGQAGQLLVETAAQAVNDTEVIPEFTAFLDLLVLQNKKLVYFNHQNLKSKSTLKGNEAARSSAIINLQKNERYKKHFLVFTQPLDSDFIKKTFDKNDNRIPSADSLKKELINEMLNTTTDQHGFSSSEKSGFSFPSAFPFWSYKEKFESILDNVQALFKEDMFNRSQRISFVLISLVFFKKYLKLTTGADIFVSICKDDLDRGGLMKVLEYYIDMILLGKKIDPEELEILITMVDGAPLMVKKQAMISERRELLIECLEFLNDINMEQLKKVSFGDYQLVDLKTYNEKKLDIYPLPSTSKSTLEYQACLEYDDILFPEDTRIDKHRLGKKQGKEELQKEAQRNWDSLKFFTKSIFMVDRKDVDYNKFFKDRSKYWSAILSAHIIIEKVDIQLKANYDNPILGVTTEESPDINAYIRIDTTTGTVRVEKTFCHRNSDGKVLATRLVKVEVDGKKKTANVTWDPAKLI